MKAPAAAEPNPPPAPPTRLVVSVPEIRARFSAPDQTRLPWQSVDPDGSDDDVMEAVGLHHSFDRELIRVARQNLAADCGEVHDLGGNQFRPLL